MLKASFTKKLRDFTLEIDGLEVAPGETLGLLGSNGAGKSTVLKILAGLMKPDSGTIELDGVILFGHKRSLDPDYRNMGYMFQNYALFPHMTVCENILYGLKMRKWSRTDAETRVDELIETLGLAEVSGENVMHLSGGQRQRTALARALAPKPALLLLDEPLSALDVKTQDLLRLELARVIRNEKIPCILVTHSARDALAVANRISYIERGKIIATGSPEEIVNDPKYGFVTAENPNIFRGEIWIKENGAVCVNVAGVVFRTVSTLSGTVNVSIRPESLILSREKFASTAVNSFSGTICSITDTGLEGEKFVCVDIGIELFAAVTNQSVERLGLQPGETVFVTCKASSVDVYV